MCTFCAFMDHVAIPLSICTSHMIHSVTKNKCSNSHLKPQKRPTLPKTPPEFQRPNLSAAVAFEHISGRLRAGKKITKSEGQKINSHFLAGWCLKIDWWMARKSFLRLRFPDGRHRKIYKQNPEPNSQPSNHRPSTRMEKKKHLQQKPAW